MEDLTLLIERYKQFYNKAFLAQQQGKRDVAKVNFMHAAEVMYDIAKKSPNNLKDVRLEKAKLLIQLAEGVVPNVKNEISGIYNDKTETVKDSTHNETSNSQFKPIKSDENYSLEDVIGLEEAKHIVRTQMILPVKFPEAYNLYKKNTGGGMILYGPPGTGKTTFAKAIANEAEAAFFYIKGSDILDMYVGSSQKNIKSLFESIRKETRAILFLDDMDSLFKKRGDDKNNDKVVTEFLQEMDGFNSAKGIMLLGATNRPWDLDSAVTRPGRFSRQVYIGLPNKDNRKFLISKFLKDAPVDSSFELELVANKTENFSGADLRELCEQAKLIPLMKYIEDNQNNREQKVYEITNHDFEEALSHISSSINLKELEQFELYRNLRSNPNTAKKDVEKKTNTENQSHKENKIQTHDTSIQIPVDHLVSIRFVLKEDIRDQVYVECDTQKYVCQKELNQWQSDQIYIESSGKKKIHVYVKDLIIDTFEVEFTQGLIEHSLGF